MKRKLTPREWIMLGVLTLLVVGVGYFILFYTPVTCKQQLEVVRLRLAKKQRMERELKEFSFRTRIPWPWPITTTYSWSCWSCTPERCSPGDICQRQHRVFRVAGIKGEASQKDASPFMPCNISENIVS